jgi:hypothetical protein
MYITWASWFTSLIFLRKKNKINILTYNVDLERVITQLNTKLLLHTIIELDIR